ncbi:hypothetical protein ACT17_06170 [Mycolicibacterium conceptionense]|uniref:Uncharacterized protein n=1 Tax=Mycolicibacterium conceptionense TaxID=451644 RepID=A0A0J8UE89_9MYCO|nr:hypothetical protein [Mycolicibacterium conceptionense]KMV19626.1 hypothetical protein ACT17_06170 [Mycolicibacterium conceptionense]
MIAAAVLAVSLLLMVALGMWCGGGRIRQASRVGLAVTIAVGWLVLVAGLSAEWLPPQLCSNTAYVCAVVAAHLIALVIGDALEIRSSRPTRSR